MDIKIKERSTISKILPGSYGTSVNNTCDYYDLQVVEIGMNDSCRIAESIDRPRRSYT